MRAVAGGLRFAFAAWGRLNRAPVSRYRDNFVPEFVVSSSRDRLFGQLGREFGLAQEVFETRKVSSNNGSVQPKTFREILSGTKSPGGHPEHFSGSVSFAILD
jgi:hypothetical protein